MKMPFRKSVMPSSFAPFSSHQLGETVEHFAVPRGVRQRIHVGVSKTVEVYGVLVHKPVAVRMRAGEVHFMDERVGIVRGLLR